MQTTGEILKKYIKKKIKRDDLAKLLGISPQYLSNIMNNKRKASASLLNKLIISLGIEGEDKEQLITNANTKEKLKNYELVKKILTKEGLKSNGSEKFYSIGGKLFDTLTELSLFVTISYNIFEFVGGDILIFKKYSGEKLENSYCLIKDKLYKVKQVNDSYILESDEIQIVKELSVEYILEYTIRRVKNE